VLLRTGREFVTPDGEIMLILRSLGLEGTVLRVGGLDADKDWDDAFSIGEQHLLSIARLFLAKPAIVYLDRPGSSLSQAQISPILDMLVARGIGVVVLSKNGESRLQYDACLEILPDGKWEIHHGVHPDAKAELGDLSC
jgi:ABC-type uncharacterized transport system fused permease/ATPase subunit